MVCHFGNQGIQIITQGNSSAVAGALIEAVDKHNKRNPDKPVLYLNYAAVTPAFTNEKCSFWHFRFDAHVDMKIAAITDYIKGKKDITKIYLIKMMTMVARALCIITYCDSAYPQPLDNSRDTDQILTLDLLKQLHRP